MKRWLTVAPVALLLFVQTSFAGVVYTFSFTAASNSVYPSFSFNETFPGYRTTDGAYGISPLPLPVGMTVTQALTCTNGGASFFQFFTAGVSPGVNCSFSFGIGSSLGLQIPFFSGYPTTDGVFNYFIGVPGLPQASLMGNGLGDPNGVAWQALGTATEKISSTPEPASWMLISFVVIPMSLLARNKLRIRRRHPC
jgi:hypothetical protein